VNNAVAEIARAGNGQAFATAEEAEAAARKEHGDNLDAVLAHANVALDAAGKEVSRYLVVTGLGNNIAVLRYLAKVGQDMVKAKTGISALQADARYTNPSHAEHKLAVLEMARLQKILAPFARDLR
jgi:hypothetical protein